MFQFNERTVRKTLLRGREDSVPLGRQAALDKDCESSIVA
jgi:hypothetical protein